MGARFYLMLVDGLVGVIELLAMSCFVTSCM